MTLKNKLDILVKKLNEKYGEEGKFLLYQKDDGRILLSFDKNKFINILVKEGKDDFSFDLEVSDFSNTTIKENLERSNKYVLENVNIAIFEKITQSKNWVLSKDFFKNRFKEIYPNIEISEEYLNRIIFSYLMYLDKILDIDEEIISKDFIYSRIDDVFINYKDARDKPRLLASFYEKCRIDFKIIIVDSEDYIIIPDIIKYDPYVCKQRKLKLFSFANIVKYYFYHYMI